MNLKRTLKACKLPRALAELKHANQVLKSFTFYSLILNILCVSLALTCFKRGPEIIALSHTGESMTLGELPNPEQEIERAIREYVSSRYSWDANSVKDHLDHARGFVIHKALKSFDVDLSGVQHFAIDRKVTQRAYVSSVEVDLAKQTAHILGDRITIIEGLTAAGPLLLTLSFESGPRSIHNPWGIYIVREKQE